MLLAYRYWPIVAWALIFMVVWAVARTLMRTPARPAGIEALFAGYLGAVCYVVFLLPVGVESDVARSVWASINLVPTRTILGIVHGHPGMVTWQIVGNVLLFVPLGLLLPVLAARFRRFAAAAAAGLGVSVGIELLQLAMLVTNIARRSVDIDDVILNVAGACLGYLIWLAAHAWSRSLARRRGVADEAA